MTSNIHASSAQPKRHEPIDKVKIAKIIISISAIAGVILFSAGMLIASTPLAVTGAVITGSSLYIGLIAKIMMLALASGLKMFN